MSNINKIAEIMGVMAHAYPRYELTPESIKLYGQMLGDIPVDVLELSAKQIIAQSKYFPSIAEWREMSHELMIGMQNIPSAYEAWEEAIKQADLCGDYYRYQIRSHEPEYSHPLIKKAVDIIGYKNLLESSNTVADRAHFFRIYESLLERGENDVRLLPESKAISAKYTEEIRKLTDKFSLLEGDEK